MGVAERCGRFVRVTAESALGGAERMADGRAAACGDRNKVQQRNAMGVYLATVAAYKSVDDADLACGAMVFPARYRGEKVPRARLGILGRVRRNGGAAREDLLLGASVPHVACGRSCV